MPAAAETCSLRHPVPSNEGSVPRTAKRAPTRSCGALPGLLGRFFLWASGVTPALENPRGRPTGVKVPRAHRDQPILGLDHVDGGGTDRVTTTALSQPMQRSH